MRRLHTLLGLVVIGCLIALVAGWNPPAWTMLVIGIAWAIYVFVPVAHQEWLRYPEEDDQG